MLALLAVLALAQEPSAARYPTLTVGPPPPPVVERAVSIAESLVGVPYVLGGRSTTQGLDCQGVLFLPYAQATSTRWRAYPWDPSYTVASGMLGKPVPGLDGVHRDEARLDHLRRGDALYLLLGGHVLEDHPLWTDSDGIDYWPWHTALYLGDGVVLHADPAGEVRTAPLADMFWEALFATRPHAGMPRSARYRGTVEDPGWTE